LGPVGRHVEAAGWQFLGWCLDRLPIRLLRSDEPEADRLHPVEHRLVSALPVGASVLSVAVEDIPITGDDDPVAFLAVNQARQVGDDPMG